MGLVRDKMDSSFDLTITDYTGTRSDLASYGREIGWALEHVGKLLRAGERAKM